ncbi:hypothetical protein C4D60_Mb01t09580 [Musa balbisiana]|uniref:Staygreen protein domain-containing protein n=1 Tax=Musa balbisiana TaxID=52838 RepID=A0A4S8JMD2_MUSBA|nr:hypothetical protein C4D60_Mb01t09580 [Musa balbisiana]
MACFSAGSAFAATSLSRAPVVSSSLMGSRTPMSTATASATPSAHLELCNAENIDVSKALDEMCQREQTLFEYARLLCPPSKFEALELKVVFMEEEMEKQILSTIPRAYTLTHCDFTANLTLAVPNGMHSPKVLKTVVHGDLLFRNYPELLEAKVWVYFHSRLKKYNRVECWGPLKDATQRTLDDGYDTSQTSVFISIGKTILHSLVAFLL